MLIILMTILKVLAVFYGVACLLCLVALAFEVDHLESVET